MFKHILVPTDGSPTALKAAKAAVRFAAETGARITAYYAIESGTPQLYGEGYGIDALSLREFERAAREAGERHVAAVTKLAKAAPPYRSPRWSQRRGRRTRGSSQQHARINAMQSSSPRTAAVACRS